mgnify:CR=1 FL=1
MTSSHGAPLGFPSPLFMMKAWVYILQSQSTGRYYCGQSTDVERRLRQHNDPDYSLSKTILPGTPYIIRDSDEISW